MPDHDDVKPDRTISHNLDDRIGATLEERANARDREKTARGARPAREAPATPVRNPGEPAAPDEEPGSRR